MTEGEHLLRLKPQDSLNQMLTNANQLRYPIYGLKASLIQPVEGVRSRVTLTGRDPVARDDPYPYQGSVEFTFNRLDVSEYFAGVLDDYRPVLPVSTQDVLNELTRRTGVEFELDDIVHEDIGRTQSVAYTLKAKAESLRWAGEITLRLSSLTELSDILSDSEPMSFTAATPTVSDLNLHVPHSNVAPYFQVNGVAKVDALVENQEVQNMTAASRQLVRDMFAFQHARGPVTIQSTPAPFNLYGAKILNKALVNDPRHVNRLNPTLNRLMRLELDLNYCTQVSEPIVYLRYTLFDNVPRTVNPYARLVNVGGLSNLDGSAYVPFLSTLTLGQIITATPSMVLDSSSPAWYASTTPGAANLFRSVVQHNGPRRPQDNSAIDRSLTHVLIVSINESYNTQWRGNLYIYYRS